MTKEFATPDMNLASSFMFEGVRYIRVERDPDPNRQRRLIFIFENSDEISRIVQQRANNTHVVTSTQYEECQRRMKSIIYSVL